MVLTAEERSQVAVTGWRERLDALPARIAPRFV